MTTVYTSAGAAQEVDIIDKTGSAITTYFVQWGSGAGNFDRTKTALFGEASEARGAATASQPADNINRWSATITANAGKTITEAGLFDVVGTGAGVMKVAGDFCAVSLVCGDSIAFTIDLRRT